MPFSFWLKTFGATFFSWTARYWVVNAILVAFWFGRYDWAQHFLIFARQLVMWIMMLVSPTPGGSGFAEFVLLQVPRRISSERRGCHSDGHFMEAHQLLPLPVYRGIYRTEMDCP